MTTPDPLHLPATIPGLLRRGSPVRRGNGRGTVTHLSEHGWVIVHDDPIGYNRNLPGFSGGSGDVRHCGWALDLYDATGRAHAAWWLSRGCWVDAPDGDPSARAIFWRARETWSGDPVPTLYLSTPEIGRGDILWTVSRVSTLADLDPTSDERLPDGSRLVDALALARVVAHVAGVGRD